ATANSCWIGTPGNLRAVARDGDLAPGFTRDERLALDSSFVPFPFNNRGQIAFGASVISSSIPTPASDSVWFGDASGLRMVVRAGDTLAVPTGGTKIVQSAFPVSLSDLGDVAVSVTYTGGVLDYEERLFHEPAAIGACCTVLTGACQLSAQGVCIAVS